MFLKPELFKKKMKKEEPLPLPLAAQSVLKSLG